jgi:hypothetical protein
MENAEPAIENRQNHTDNDRDKLSNCDGVLDWVIRSIERAAKRDLEIIEKRIFNKKR